MASDPSTPEPMPDPPTKGEPMPDKPKRCGAPYPPRSEVRCQKPSGHDGPHGDDEAPGFWSWPQNWQPPELPSDSPTEERWTIERFDCEEETRGRGYMTYTVPEMVPYKDGEWVRFTEAASQVEALQAEVDDWKRVTAEQENRAKLQEDRALALQAKAEEMERWARDQEAQSDRDKAKLSALQAEVERLREALDDIEQVYAVRDGHLPTATCLHGEERYPWCPRCIARAALSPQPEEQG